MNIRSSRQLKALVRNMSKENSVEAYTLMRFYMMERFLERLSLSSYRNDFILKGGFLIVSLVGVKVRSTMDIDVTVQGQNLTTDAMRGIITDIERYRSR